MNLYEMEKELSERKMESQEDKAIKHEYDPIRIDPILVFQNEPNKLPLSLVPLVFNMNLVVYIFDGALGTNQEIKFIKQSFTNPKLLEESETTITIFYNMSSYHKVYTKEFYEKHHEILDPLLVQEYGKNLYLGNKFQCEVCNLKTDHAIFEKYPDIAFCVECAKTCVKNTLEKRAKIYIAENFHNRECKNYP